MLLIIIESSLLNESVPFCALQEFVSPLFSIISLMEELENPNASAYFILFYSLLSHFVLWTESMTYATFHGRNEGIQKAKPQAVLRPNSRQVFVPRRSSCLHVTAPKAPQGWEATGNCSQQVDKHVLSRLSPRVIICAKNVIDKKKFY